MSKLAVIGIMLQHIVVVPRRRLELPRPNGHWHLKPARLPIPPPGQLASAVAVRVQGEDNHKVRDVNRAIITKYLAID